MPIKNQMHNKTQGVASKNREWSWKMKELICSLLKTTKVKFLGSQRLAWMRNSSLQLSKVSNDLEGSKLRSVAIAEGGGLQL